jgi:hypothetical protein
MGSGYFISDELMTINLTLLTKQVRESLHKQNHRNIDVYSVWDFSLQQYKIKINKLGLGSVETNNLYMHPIPNKDLTTDYTPTEKDAKMKEIVKEICDGFLLEVL